jgi:hypothetical protein
MEISGMSVAIIIVVYAIIYGLGVATGNSSNPPTRGPDGSEPPRDCAEACAAWDEALQRLCNARSDEAAARRRADAIRAQMIAMLALAAALAGTAAALAAAAAATAATIVGIPAAIVLVTAAAAMFTLAAAALAGATLLAGQLTAAESDQSSKARARAEWEQVVTTARTAVNRLCSQAEANACLSRTPPC